MIETQLFSCTKLYTPINKIKNPEEVFRPIIRKISVNNLFDPDIRVTRILANIEVITVIKEINGCPRSYKGLVLIVVFSCKCRLYFTLFDRIATGLRYELGSALNNVIISLPPCYFYGISKDACQVIIVVHTCYGECSFSHIFTGNSIYFLNVRLIVTGKDCSSREEKKCIFHGHVFGLSNRMLLDCQTTYYTNLAKYMPRVGGCHFEPIFSMDSAACLDEYGV